MMIIRKSDWSDVKNKLMFLFKESFHRNIENGYFDWRYINNGHEQILIDIDIEDDTPTSSYSIFPANLICDGIIYKTGISMSTMTHPDWQGKGLIVKLGNELYTHAKDIGFAGVWGFPNSNFHSVLNKKLGWSDIYEVPTMSLNLQSTDLCNFTLSDAVGRDDDFSLNYPESPKDGLIRINRTRDYLIWRYALNPVNSYVNFAISDQGNVTSYIVLKKYKNDFDLVDIQTAIPDEAQVLLSHVLKWCLDQNAKAQYVNCWAPTHHSLHAILERLGFVNAAPITYFGGRELIPSGLPSDWLSYKKWYLQMGDSDVY